MRYPVKPNVGESEINRAIAAALTRMGWRVYNFASDHALPRAAAGFADLVAVHPGLPVLFIQCKRPGGKLTEQQREFAELICADTHALYIQASSLDDVIAMLDYREIIHR